MNSHTSDSGTLDAMWAMRVAEIRQAAAKRVLEKQRHSKEYIMIISEYALNMVKKESKDGIREN